MKAISFYNSNINPLLVEYQKKVFNHLGLEVDQILHSTTHGEAIDNWLKENDWDHVAIFDIDCIPLDRFTLHHAYAQSIDHIFGAAQQANHLSNKNIYVSPAFICLSKENYIKSGSPTFKDGNGFDIGGFVSHVASSSGIKLSLLWPTEVEVPKWNLGTNSTFGYGTTYQNMVYHAFESRMNHESTSRFIAKCKEVIGE